MQTDCVLCQVGTEVSYQIYIEINLQMDDLVHLKAINSVGRVAQSV